MSLEKIESLSLNPHFFKHVIMNFLSGYNKPCDLKLIFMVLPIILYAPSREKLTSAKSTSRLETTFNTPIQMSDGEKLSGKTRLTGFISRYDSLQEITKKTIIILYSEKSVTFNERYIISNKSVTYKDYNKKISSWMKAAYYLGIIFSKTSEDHISYFLGVE